MADNDKELQIDLSQNAQFKQMQDLMGAMGKAVQQLSKGQEIFQEEIRKSALVAEKPEPIEVETPKEVDSETINEMDNAQFMGHMLKSIRKEVDSIKGDLKKDIDDTRGILGENELRRQVETFAEKHPEILGIVPEMTAKLEEYPTLKFQDAFKLVIEDLPDDKLTELKDQYNLESDTNGKDKEPPTAFLGLTPTSGRGTSGEPNAGMTRDQAKDTAWEEAVAAFPNLGVSE